MKAYIYICTYTYSFQIFIYIYIYLYLFTYLFIYSILTCKTRRSTKTAYSQKSNGSRRTASLALMKFFTFYFLADGEIMPPAFGGIKRTRNMYKWHSTRILVKQKWIRCIHRNIQGGWGAQMKIAPLKEVEPTLRPFGGAYLRYKATTQHICTHLPDNLGYTSECDCVCVSSLRKRRANENSEHCKQRSN